MCFKSSVPAETGHQHTAVLTTRLCGLTASFLYVTVNWISLYNQAEDSSGPEPFSEMLQTKTQTQSTDSFIDGNHCQLLQKDAM